MNQASATKQSFITINNTCINRNDISIFYWDDEAMEINIKTKLGDTHIFCFIDRNEFRQAVWLLEEN